MIEIGFLNIDIENFWCLIEDLMQEIVNGWLKFEECLLANNDWRLRTSLKKWKTWNENNLNKIDWLPGDWSVWVLLLLISDGF